MAGESLARLKAGFSVYRFWADDVSLWSFYISLENVWLDKSVIAEYD
jgi:hypothetical protein